MPWFKKPSVWALTSLAAALYAYAPHYLGCDDAEPSQAPSPLEVNVHTEEPKKPLTSAEVKKVLDRYGKTIEQYLKIENSHLDSYVVGSIIHHESGGNPRASNGSCYGLMQKSGAEYKKTLGQPRRQLQDGIDHLAKVGDKFEGYTARTELTLAAYNIGDAVITDAIKATKENDPSWDTVHDHITPNLLAKYFPEWSKGRREQRVKALDTYVNEIMQKAYVADGTAHLAYTKRT